MTSIQKRPNGKWRARYLDPSGKERSNHFDRKTDARRYLDEMTTSIVSGQYVDPKAGRVTLRDYFVEYAARQTWADTYVTAMNLAISRAPFTDSELGKIRRSTVEKWVKGMASDGLAPGTIKTRLSNVGTVLRAAKRDRVLAEDPSEGVSPPRGTRKNVDLHLPTSKDVGFLSDAADESFKPYLALASFGGLRLGEISGLRIGDIDFLKRQILVRRQVQRSPSGRRASSIVVTPPKARVVSCRPSPRRPVGRHLRVHPHPPARSDQARLAVRDSQRRPAASEHSRLLVPEGQEESGRRERDLARPSPLLRIWADRRGVRRCHRSAGTGARQSLHNPQHLRASLAHGRGTDARRSRGAHGRHSQGCDGLLADCNGCLAP